jgi:hypothetical protein
MNIVTQIENKINNITNFSDLTDAAQFASSEIATAIFLETIKSVDDKFLEMVHGKNCTPVMVLFGDILLLH